MLLHFTLKPVLVFLSIFVWYIEILNILNMNYLNDNEDTSIVTWGYIHSSFVGKRAFINN